MVIVYNHVNLLVAAIILYMNDIALYLLYNYQCTWRKLFICSSIRSQDVLNFVYAYTSISMITRYKRVLCKTKVRASCTVKAFLEKRLIVGLSIVSVIQLSLNNNSCRVPRIVIVNADFRAHARSDDTPLPLHQPRDFLSCRKLHSCSAAFCVRTYHRVSRFFLKNERHPVQKKHPFFLEFTRLFHYTAVGVL